MPRRSHVRVSWARGAKGRSMVRPTTDESRSSPEEIPSSVPTRSALRMFILGAAIVFVVLGALITTLKLVVIPAFEGSDNGSYARAQATIGALQTQEAIGPQQTSIAAPKTAAQLGPEPTLSPTSMVPAASATEVAPAVRSTITSTPGVAPTAPGVAATARATILPALDTEISQAYLRYFQARSDALLALDPAPLDEVAAGSASTGLQKDIEGDRAQGRALQTSVQHEFVVW